MDEVWIGFNALENPRESFRWATDETLDPASAVAQLVSDEEVALPWSGDLLWVGEEGSCASTQLCAAGQINNGEILRASLHQCDGPIAPARCLCEFSTVSSAAGTPFDSSDGVSPSVCGGGNKDMCSSWGSDCKVLATGEEQVFTCRNGYSSQVVSSDCSEKRRCTEYECCDPRTTLSQTIAAANEVIYDQYDGRFVDEDACYWEEQWHYWVIGYATFYAVLGLSFLLGFLVACGCCAPKQAFSTRIQSCGDDVGICCLTCWCPCITWGRIAKFTLDLPSYVGCLIYCCCSNLTCCMGMLGRAELRKKLAIGAVTTAGTVDVTADCCVDCCVHCCAHSCALCQEMREIDLVHSGGRSIPAPMTMGMIPAHGAVVQAHVVGAAQPMQASAVALPVGAVAVPSHGDSGTPQSLPGETGTEFNPAAKTEHQP
jgi:Cys-rich protein (TIGR01571 family)